MGNFIPSNCVVQIAIDARRTPAIAEFIRWTEQILITEKTQGEVTIRIVDVDEITELNHKYRHNNHPTNVLAFPFINPDIPELEPILGDVVICAEVVEKEAIEQGRDLRAYYAHILVHGLLHLAGYNHIEDDEAEFMQIREQELLQKIL